MNNRRRLRSYPDRLLAFAAVAMLVTACPVYGQNGAIGTAFPASGITVDGDLSDWPKGLKTYPIERLEFGDKLANDRDLKASFRLAYNPGERALYVGVEVLDDSMVLDGPGEPVWNGQDGCEVFLDAAHSPTGSPIIQFARYGDQDRTAGPIEDAVKMMKVAVTRTDSRTVYEWRIATGAALDPERVIGFDISIDDKDKDGSFSWAAWGPGTQKVDVGGRCGEFLLVTPETRFGEVSGRLVANDPSLPVLPARVRIQSSRTPELWRDAAVDSSGNYKPTTLPSGPYAVHNLDTLDIRVDMKPHVDVEIEPGQLAKAGPLRVSTLPWPGLIGEEGVLRTSAPLDRDALDRVVAAYLEYFKIPGISLAVIKDFDVVYQRGLGVRNTATREPVTDDTVFEAASMTKPLFAYIVLRLADRGVLDLDTPLYKYLPYEDIAHDERYKQITGRMVLTHRSGFPNWRNGKLEIKFTPGTEVAYSGEGFVYLGKVVEKLTGKTLVELSQQEVFTPLGIENASLVWNDTIARLTATAHGGGGELSPGTAPLPKWKPKDPNVAASLHINAKNYAKFLVAVVQGKGLSQASAKEMLRAQVRIPDQADASWGLGVFIEETPVGTNYGHSGRNNGFTSRSLLYKDQGIGFVVLVNNDDVGKMNDVLNACLIAGKDGLKYSGKIMHKRAEIDPKVYEAYVGRYRLNDAILTLTSDGGRLKAQAGGDPSFEVFPESESRFFVKPTTDTTLTFVKDDKGKIGHLIFHHEGVDSRANRLEDEPAPAAAK